MTPRRSLVCLVALVVAASVAATAHGLYAVALASGVPWQVACLYPLITDGLALVAYWATKQLASTFYPWLVVVVAAGLSGLAQAVNLAGLGESPTWLRFGVGYWPAVAALLAAHLLWLVWRPRVEAGAGMVGSSVREEVTDAGGSGDSVPVRNPDPPAPDGTSDGTSNSIGDLMSTVAGSNGNGHGKTKVAKAVATVAAYRQSNGGRLPSRPELALLAGVSESTARDALALTREK